MIRRNSSNARNYNERLTSAQFVGVKGIDVNKACDSKNTLLNLVNFDVDEDGGLKLRKPLIFSKDCPYPMEKVDCIYFNYLFDNVTMLTIKPYNDNYYIYIGNNTIALKYTEYTGTVNTNLISLNKLTDMDCSNIRVINTYSSTIITGVKINLTTYNLADPELYKGTPIYGYRDLRIYKDENTDRFIVEIINPEANLLSSAESAVFNPNLELDYAYALKDNYNASSVGVSNIFAYALTKVTDPSKAPTPITSVFDTLSIKRLTETVSGDIAPRIVTKCVKTLTPVCLKAIIDVKASDETQYVCIWEKTFDGVNWLEIPNFTDGKHAVLLKIPDTSKSNETLTSSESYSYKKCLIFNPKNSEEIVKNRPDCLILTSLDNATYRFTIYSLKSVDTDSLTYSSVTGTLDNVTNILISKQNFFKQVNRQKSLGEESSRNFNITFNISEPSISPPILKDINTDDFSVKVIYQNGQTFRSGSTLNLRVTHLNEHTSATNLYTETVKLLATYDKHIFQNTFYNCIPTLIKIYYKEKLFCTIKELYTEMLNVPQVIWNEAPSTHYSNSVIKNLCVPTEGESKKPTITKTSNEESFFEPIPTMILDSIIKEVPKNNTLYQYVEFLVYSVDMKTYYGSNFNIEYVNSTLHVDDIPKLKYTFSSFLDSDILSPNFGDQTPYDYMNSFESGANVTFKYTPKLRYALISDGMKYQVIRYSDKFEDASFTIFTTSELYSWYYNIYHTKNMSQNLPTLYNSVDVTDSEASDDEEYVEINLTLGTSSYTFNLDTETEYLYSDITNTAKGEKLYYKKAIYTYGKEFGANIYPSDTDSFITPLFNIIDLDVTGSSYVTTLVSWRSYLVAATENAVYLITKQDEGYYTKIVNNFIGIPYQDRKTCKSILNGIIFKAGSKIYTLQPNAYSSDDSILNISEISKPIEGLIPSTDKDNFAFSTETAYYLFIPKDTYTVCFKYEYSKRIWTQFKYPDVLVDYKLLSLDDIRLMSARKEYYFDKYLKDIFPDASDAIRYGDYPHVTQSSIDNYEINPDSMVTPIEFYLNSGQKADVMSTTKQFVESKFVVATLNDKDQFPFTLNISIDGTIHPIHFDVNTDSAFWKTAQNELSTLSTNFMFNETKAFNTLRQMFVRYSGKGKTIQHEIQGVSYFNFKIYMIYYRYRTLNVKQ